VASNNCAGIRAANLFAKLNLDHHLLRSRKGEKWLDWVSSITNHKVICAADFMGQNRNLLEADRVSWYKKIPVPKGWHEAYSKGETDTRAYQAKF
jgi:predicted metallo-beta-lactamase superfamily hydrolase